MCTYVRRFNNRNETHQGSCSCDPELRDSSCYDKQGATENLNKPQPQAPLSEHIWTKNMILHHCCFPWWWKCEVFFPLLLGTLNLLVPHPLEKTVHNKAWGLAANFWDFAANAWGLAANACSTAMLDHSGMKSYLSAFTCLHAHSCMKSNLHSSPSPCPSCLLLLHLLFVHGRLLVTSIHVHVPP